MIPDPGKASGYFGALERATPIVVRSDIGGGNPTTTSMRIANGTDNAHRAVLQLIGDNLPDFEEFGGVAFEMQPFDTAGGTQQRRVAILNEEHATLLLTYMRNNEIVRDFKKRLVREFSALRRQMAPAAPAAMPSHAEALRAWAEQLERAELAESQVRELSGPASSWNELAEAAGDYSVADAAKVLARGGVKTGERRLFIEMARLRWVFKRDGRWRAYQTQIDLDRLHEKVGKPYVRNGEMQNGDPTVRITPKGLQELHRLFGNGGEQLALASVE